jgi:nuclear pore complex protein Nup98-Nup96
MTFTKNAPTTMSRPARKFTRVPPELSLTVGRDGNYHDLGLSMGRSFRVGWGPGGTIAHIGTLCGVSQRR